jgi:hypothetical protein
VSLADALAAGLGDTITASRPVSGGSINEAMRVDLASGRRVFVKSRAGAPAAEFAAEAAGLAWLADAIAIAVPEVLAFGGGEEPWLALEWVAPGALTAEGEEELGRDLAALHRSGAEAHGVLPPARPTSCCGSARSSFRRGPAPAGPSSTPSSGCARCWRRRSNGDRSRAATRKRSSRSAIASKASPAPTNRRRVCTGTSGAAMSWPTRAGIPG